MKHDKPWNVGLAALLWFVFSIVECLFSFYSETRFGHIYWAIASLFFMFWAGNAFQRFMDSINDKSV